jgi:glycosyltransferase involved in cell wall biosynthesis
MPKLCILTNFREWNDAHSLTHVVHAQALTLAKAGHDVTVFTVEGCPANAHDFPWHYQFDSCIPDFTIHPYTSVNDLSDDHNQYASKLSQILIARLSGFDAVLTHDWITLGHNLPLAEALRLSSAKLLDIPFFHWIHSTPNYGPYNWWNINRYGKNHKIVYPNKTDSDFVALTFKGSPADIRVIPHVVDLRLYFDFMPDTCAIIDELPSLMSAEFVQVYPAAVDRLKDKGLRQLILTFKALKQKGHSICLLIVDSWTGRGLKEEISGYQRIVERNGLTNQEIAFSSTLMEGKFPAGLPKRVLRELSQCSSVFIYPTRGEAFGLPLPETALAASALPVFNRNLPMHFEVGGGNGLYANFGSSEQQWKPTNEKEYYEMLAHLILARAQQDDTLQYRTFVRRSFNMDRVYKNFYAPVLTEGVSL